MQPQDGLFQLLLLFVPCYSNFLIFKKLNRVIFDIFHLFSSHNHTGHAMSIVTYICIQMHLCR